MAKKDSFWYLAHCESGVPSSKRLWGGVGFCICQLCILAATILSFIHTGEMSGTVSSLIDFDLGISATLLGLSTITRMFEGNKTTLGREKDDQSTENAEE
jgi:hypothetical protein